MQTVDQAFQARGGWDEIAQHPEWGLFKFGHTHPNQSNSGLTTIILAAYSYHHKTKDLDPQRRAGCGLPTLAYEELERGASGISNSTGNMMKEMVLKGPSSYDAIFVYENVAIDYLKNAEGRWGQLRVAYPEYNAWNDNPYYIINASWSTPDQRKAAILSQLPADRADSKGIAGPRVPSRQPECSG